MQHYVYVSAPARLLGPLDARVSAWAHWAACSWPHCVGWSAACRLICCLAQEIMRNAALKPTRCARALTRLHALVHARNMVWPRACVCRLDVRNVLASVLAGHIDAPRCCTSACMRASVCPRACYVDKHGETHLRACTQSYSSALPALRGAQTCTTGTEANGFLASKQAQGKSQWIPYVHAHLHALVQQRVAGVAQCTNVHNKHRNQRIMLHNLYQRIMLHKLCMYHASKHTRTCTHSYSTALPALRDASMLDATCARAALILGRSRL